jgi:hypothetical protein
MGQNILRDAFSTSSSAHPTPQASVEPAPPTSYILSKATDVALSLVKPTRTHTKATQTLFGWPKLTAWMELVAEKVEPSAGSSDVALHAMKTQVKRL